MHEELNIYDKKRKIRKNFLKIFWAAAEKLKRFILFFFFISRIYFYINLSDLKLEK